VLQRPAYVQQTTWPLNLPPPPSLESRRHGRKVLLVQDFQAAPGLEQRGVEWLNANGSVHIDFYNLWEVLPASAVTYDARRWLAASGLFAAVVGPGSGLTPDLMLNGELTSFIADPRVLRAKAALAITLLDLRSVPPRVLTQRSLSASAPMPKPTPDGVVAGQRAALAHLLHELVRTLARFA
jgi:cholesterol transport system auxiliary component